MAEIPNAEPIQILLVEDKLGDDLMVEIQLSEASSSANFEIARVESLGEALERLEHSRFDAILVDLSLADSSSLESVSRLRTAAFQTPIVVLSGWADEETSLQALHMGVQDYLIKGQTDSDLVVRSIRNAIGRARTQEELRRSEERFRLLVEGVKDYAIFMLYPDGRVASWNDAAEHIHGYRAGEIEGEHFSVLYSEEDVARAQPEEQLRVAAAKGRYEEEGLRIRKNGSVFWAEAVITALRDEAGNLRGYSHITRDITGRKETEEALRRSLRELANIKLALDEAAIVAMADEKGMITYVNERFCEASGYTREEFMSQDRQIVDADYHPDTLVDDVWRTITRGEVWRGEIKNPTRDGAHFWLDATIVPFLDGRGAPYRYAAICSNITQRKEAEEALRRSLGELANLKFAQYDEGLSDRDYRSADTDRHYLRPSDDNQGWTVA